MSAEEPAIMEEAEHQPYWCAAMEEEMKAIVSNDTWTMIDLPAQRKAIGLKWVFRVKRDKHGAVIRYKARLVVKSYSQQHDIDYEKVFALVAK
jgi:hypothetical protein